MGTRAVIKWEDKPMLATHWDGYPKGLGIDLIKAKPKTISNVVKVASHHNIDLIDPKFAPKKNIEIPAKVMNEKGKLVKGKKVTKFVKSGDLMPDMGTSFTKGNIDFKLSEVTPMSDYGDFAEWEYNIKKGKVYARELEGGYSTDKKINSKWRLLSSPAFAKKYEDEITEKSNMEYEKKELKKAKINPVYGAVEIMHEMLSRSEGKIPYFEEDVKKVDETFFPEGTYKDTLTPENKKVIQNYLKIPKVRKLIHLGKGWHYESLRHRLASYGIKTKRN